MNGKAAVVGAGVLGRLLALRLQREGWTVELYDRGHWSDRNACSFAAAGLLTPAMEATHCGNSALFNLGMRSLDLWSRELLSQGKSEPLLSQGTLHLAYAQDEDLLHELRERIGRRYPNASPRMLQGNAIGDFEPALKNSPFKSALMLPYDGYLNSHEVMTVLQRSIDALPITCHHGTHVTHIESKRVVTQDNKVDSFDCVFDCRGLGARVDLSSLRGVRGELIELYAPEVEIHHPLHLVHGRYPIYLVPRGGHRYALGATNIESESERPVSVKSVMELLSLVYGVHPGFRYAEIHHLVANCRPAFPDNFPKVAIDNGIWRLNGLYRYGFLMSPLLVDVAVKVLNRQSLDHDELQLTASPNQQSEGCE